MFCLPVFRPVLPIILVSSLLVSAHVSASRATITPLDQQPYQFDKLHQAIGFYQTLNTLPWPELRKTNQLLRLADRHPDLELVRHQLL